ncbi:MAG: alpha-galactosidase [Spirochaetales bacterium]|nr:alpha-galactosidase [Spirochaetales bacterium]
MSIEYIDSQKLFHLKTPSSSYFIRLEKGKHPVHLGWHGAIKNWGGSNDIQCFDRAFSPNPRTEERSFSLDNIPLEYSAWGRTDLRTPSLQVEGADGSMSLDLEYREHSILPGKPLLDGLPSVYLEDDSEADTLVLTLEDPLTGLLCDLSYTVFAERDVITRSVRLRNGGKEELTVKRIMSLSLDLEDSDYTLVQLSGAHNRERRIHRRPLASGMQSVESRRGTSSHQQNPFIALMKGDAGEDQGIVYGFSLVYSGNFLAAVDVDQFDSPRVIMGINPFDFAWRLEPGSEFQTPEAVMVRSGKGLGAMSRTYHDLYRSRLCRGAYRDRERPVLINNWEATYFDFDSNTILNLADEASRLGIELFVLDDGWFGERDNDLTSLGDWFPHKKKLPGGIRSLAEGILEKGMSFGIWVEPEMISEKSRLYEAHPDWCIRVKRRNLSTGRSQLVLDYSRRDVRDYIVGILSDILRDNPVSYVKWDMNRHLTEVGSALLPAERQRETSHRFVLGVYDVLERITSAFPEVLFESCSGGGGRFDPGMLYYMPQTWTSDNTDAISRLSIQAGTSLVYPPLTMGAHVSAVPNHQTGRTVSLKTRGAVAMGANFGYELNLLNLSADEKDQIKEQVAEYKKRRHLILDGSHYRLIEPWKQTDRYAWMTVSPDRREALAVFVSVHTESNHPYGSLKLKGLDRDMSYSINGEGSYGGDELMESGIRLPYPLFEADAHEFHIRAL